MFSVLARLTLVGRPLKCGGRLATPWLYGSSTPCSSRALESRSGPFVVAAVDVSVEHADSIQCFFRAAPQATTPF